MSLVGPWLNTTSTKKRAEKITKSKQAEFERGWHERNERLKGMCLPKETFEQYMDFVYGRTQKKKTMAHGIKQGKMAAMPGVDMQTVQTKCEAIRKIPSLVVESGGVCTTKPSIAYTGTKILGIAQMAKSNAVPVFNENEIFDIARMRR